MDQGRGARRRQHRQDEQSHQSTGVFAEPASDARQVPLPTRVRTADAGVASMLQSVCMGLRRSPSSRTKALRRAPHGSRNICRCYGSTMSVSWMGRIGRPLWLRFVQIVLLQLLVANKHHTISSNRKCGKPRNCKPSSAALRRRNLSQILTRLPRAVVA
jgi:hypothetical protein